MKKLLLLSLLFASLGIKGAFAQTNVASVSGSNSAKMKKKRKAFVPAIYFVKAQTLPKGKTAVRSYYVKPFVTKMYNNASGDMTKLPDMMDVNLNTIAVFGSYGVTETVTLGMNAKFLFNQIGMGSATKKGYGVGDVEALLKIALMQTKVLRFSFAINVSFPTGSIVETNTTMPLGSDSFDYSFRLLSDFRIFKTHLTAAFFYTLNGRAITSGVDYGDSIRLIITEAIPLPLGFSL